MRRLTRIFAFASALAAVPAAFAVVSACSSSSSTPASSSGDGGSGGGGDAAIESSCGEPGDMGNELGVGKFCQTFEDCTSTPNAKICSIIGDKTTHFCTLSPCNPEGGAGSTDGGCGTGATCSCDSQGCGCTPNKCL